jgi:carbonic anhydrase/acetyltransferase-like protein (isoleucine patch superfamily)
MPCYTLPGLAAPTIAADAWVAPTADLIGDVQLGALASIWFAAVVRADNTPVVIGARSNVQDGAVLHSDPGAPLTIGADVTVGHRAVLHGCSIADGCLIGMGAIVLNSAEIGPGSLVGAGALVTENKRFGPGQLIVGNPARAIRTLDAGQQARMAAGAAIYVAKARACAAGLVRVG